MAFARHQFELSAVQPDGETLAATMQAYEEKAGKAHSFIANAPTLPEGLESLWQAFEELHGSRGSTGWGSQRIMLGDFDAFQRVERRLSQWERRLIRRTDNLWLSEFAPKPKAGQ